MGPPLAEMLYWLGSTIVQSVAALLAVGSFIGTRRRDEVLSVLTVNDYRRLGLAVSKLADCEIEETRNTSDGTQIHTVEAGFRVVLTDGNRARVDTARVKGKALRDAADRELRSRLGAIAARHWGDFPFGGTFIGAGREHISVIRGIGRVAIEVNRVAARIKIAMDTMITAGLTAFGLGTLLIMLAPRLAVPNRSGLEALVMALLGTVLLTSILWTTALCLVAATAMIGATRTVLPVVIDEDEGV